MKNTDALIRKLSQDGRAPRMARLGPRLWLAAAMGLAAAMLCSAWLLDPRDDLGAALSNAPLIAKLLAMGSVAWTALAALERLARPGARLFEIKLLAPAALALLSLATLWSVSRPETANAASALACMASIVLLAAPPFVALFAALRASAPQDPLAAGAAAGALAAALGALGFALHCPIDHGPTVMLWYGAAIGLTAGLGGLLGARILRW